MAANTPKTRSRNQMVLALVAALMSSVAILMLHQTRAVNGEGQVMGVSTTESPETQLLLQLQKTVDDSGIFQLRQLKKEIGL